MAMPERARRFLSATAVGLLATAVDVVVLTLLIQLGIAVVVAARGPLTSGEISLFFAYLVGMTWLPMRLGGLVSGRRRFEVSAERMDALVASPSGSMATSSSNAAVATPAVTASSSMP